MFGFQDQTPRKLQYLNSWDLIFTATKKRFGTDSRINRDHTYIYIASAKRLGMSDPFYYGDIVGRWVKNKVKKYAEVIQEWSPTYRVAPFSRFNGRSTKNNGILPFLSPGLHLFRPQSAQYSCNNITTTLIQISRLFYFGFFSKTNHQMII